MSGYVWALCCRRTDRQASPSVPEAIEQLAENMSPTACQELVGCTGGCMEMVKGKKLSSEDCRKFDSYLGDCEAKDNKEPTQFKATRKAKVPVKSGTPPKVAVKPVRLVVKEHLRKKTVMPSSKGSTVA